MRAALLQTLAATTTGVVLAGITVGAGAAPAHAAAGFRIHNLNSGLCLRAPEGAGERPVSQGNCVGADSYWELVAVPDTATYRIRSSILGLCLTTRGPGESAAVATTCAPNLNSFDWPDQIWSLRYDGAKNADQYSNRNSGLCLAARGPHASRALQTTCEPPGENWPDQFWR